VQTKTITKLCKTSTIVTVNGMYPGPIVYAQEEDRVIMRVTNLSPYNVTLHWHGVRQKRTCWFDGPAYITQCPIQAGKTFTYEFTLLKQKGTMFWHAHVSWLRATVHGPIVIYPKAGVPYPFQFPYEEHVLVLGEYWIQDAQSIEKQTLQTGGGPPQADAYVINGHPGPLYNCSKDDVYSIDVIPQKTYLLRIINAALNMEHFFAIANHKMTVVEADGEYTKALTTDYLVITPGQTFNVLVTADQPVGRYSMSMGPYMSAKNIPFQKLNAVSYFSYRGFIPNRNSFLAKLPIFNDNQKSLSFMNGLKSLADKQNPINVPMIINRNLFFTVGLNILQCKSKPQNCKAPNGGVFAASINNITFVRPAVSILQAYYNNISGYYTTDFPNKPSKILDFVNNAPNNLGVDTQSTFGTKVTVLDYGSNVQLILQNTGTAGTDNHPIHLHGFSFYLVGYGFGNYNANNAVFNLVDPPYINTIGVPVGGWAAVRFTADNPGVWFMHCHLEIHSSWGLSTAFIVKNGNGVLQTLPPPPSDLPLC
ncbi:hypothetical protein KI387_024759, partial [Taxus chinensis]